jgi:hypothetical protein
MEPIENEPKGWDENQQSNATDFDGQADKETKAPDIDTTNSGMAGNADGNTLEDDDAHPTPPPTDDPRGFMGDYSEPQHDD